MHQNHPNLSDDINSKLAKRDIEGGIWLKMPEEYCEIAYKEAKEKGNVLQVGKSLIVMTKNTLYKIERRGEDEYYISGHAEFCPTPTKAYIHGSTFGGSMIQLNYVGRSMHLQFNTDEQRSGYVTTSAIQDIWEE